ncbi:MAG: PIG-L family deacetylase [Bacteroidetes bacterium]|nr:PIG-L family deacetylase [Bacteroidota bacterium]
MDSIQMIMNVFNTLAGKTKSILKVIFFGFGFLILLIVGLICFLFYRSSTEIKQFISVNEAEKIAIIVAHQDDGVIIAGGYAIQTLKSGGSVKVVYLTNGAFKNDFELANKRKREAIITWKLIGLGEQDIIFLNYWQLELEYNIDRAVFQVSKILKYGKFDKIFIPLYEGGHHDHDMVNYIVSLANKVNSVKSEIYECPLYNLYYSLTNTPEKILYQLSRIIPYWDYGAPPSFVDKTGRIYLNMSKQELKLKRKMLSQFKSQGGRSLANQYSFNDRYQKHTDHDYSNPPFNYDMSFVKLVNKFKSLPVIGSLIEKVFRRSVTIHREDLSQVQRFKIIPNDQILILPIFQWR